MMILLLAGGGFLSFNTGFALWILVTMIVFIAIMAKFAVPTIAKALDERELKIKSSLEAAEKAMARAEEVSAKNEKVLREAELNAQQIRNGAKEQAEAIRAERLDKAQSEAKQLVEDAHKAIEQQKQQALQELRSEVASLVIQATEHLLRSEIDKKKNEKLVDEFINEIHKN